MLDISGMGARIDLWAERALITAPLGTVQAHAHAATAVLVGVNGTFRVREQRDGHISGALRGAVVPLGCVHALECDATQVSVLMLAPGQVDHRRLFEARGYPDDGRVVTIEPPRELLDLLEATRHSDLDDETIDGELSGLLGVRPSALVPDPRVAQAAHHIAEAPDANLPLAQLARCAGISPSRLQHLFAEELGITPRKLRTWLRMRRVSALVGDGRSLTEAAHEAGFADSAHLSRAFRSTFGLPPSRVLSPHTTVRAHETRPAFPPQ